MTEALPSLVERVAVSFLVALSSLVVRLSSLLVSGFIFCDSEGGFILSRNVGGFISGSDGGLIFSSSDDGFSLSNNCALFSLALTWLYL